MASTFQGTALDRAGGARIGPSGDAGSLRVVAASYVIAAALVADDVIVGPTVPKGSTIYDVVLYSTDLDTGGSPALTLNVGTPASELAFISGSTAGQAGGIARAAVVGALPVVVTADTIVQAQVGTAPATGATSGTVTIAVFFIPPNG